MDGARNDPSQPLWEAALLLGYLTLATAFQFLSRAFRLEPGTFVWFAGPALTMAFALAAPRRLRWAVFIVHLPYALIAEFHHLHVLHTLAIGLLHGGAYGMGILLLRHWGFDPSLRRGVDLTLFLLYAAVACLVFALPVGILLHSRPTEFGVWSHRVPRLWLEDMVGTLAWGPPLLLYLVPLRGTGRETNDPVVSPLRIFEVLLQGLVLVGTSTLVLMNPGGGGFPLAYLGFLPLLWSALRWGLRGAAVAALLFITAMGGEYVALGHPAEGLMDLQFLLIVMTATALVVGNLVDGRREHRRTLLQQGVQLSTLLRGSGAVPFEMEARTGKCTLLGRGALILSGHSMEEWKREPFWGAVVDPLHLPRLQAYFLALLEDHGQPTVEVALRSAGAPRWIEVAGSAFDVKDRVGGFLHDISTRKAMEEKLQASEAHFRQLVDQSLIPTAVHQDGRFVYANDAALQLMGYGPGELIGHPVDQLIHTEELDDSLTRRARALRGEPLPPVERRLLRRDGSVVFVDLLTIGCQHQGRPAAQVLAVDLTARKAVENALLDRLQEKELLIREIHHRVKNNLQVVSSLLRLQSILHPMPELTRALDEAQGRIHAIAAVHQRLHQAASLAPEDLPDYVERLIEQLVQTFAAAPGLIHTRIEVAPLALGADQLVPLGLILHEAVLNTLRHAFPPGEGGGLEVVLQPEGDEVQLRISDDGRGLPPELDLRQGGGLGFQMMRALSDQLKGRLEVVSAGGTTLRLRFPAPPPPRP